MLNFFPQISGPCAQPCSGSNSTQLFDEPQLKEVLEANPYSTRYFREC